MPIVHIRVIEFISDLKNSSINYLQIYLHTHENPEQIEKMKITTNKKGNIMKCEKSISFTIESQLDNYLYLNLKRNRFLFTDEEIGILILPLNWFPTNHIVREWFPFKGKKIDTSDGMVLLDIHVDNRDADPFMAPFATLKVFPNWKKPTLCENSEVPVNPPIIYVLPPNSQTVPSFQQTNGIPPALYQQVNIQSVLNQQTNIPPVLNQQTNIPPVLNQQTNIPPVLNQQYLNNQNASNLSSQNQSDTESNQQNPAFPPPSNPYNDDKESYQPQSVLSVY